MAQVIDKIVRSKYPPRDTRVLWFDTTDDSLKSFTSNGWNKSSAKIMENITYSKLKYLRDNGKLIPGQQYRITDYECTTSQENTKSAGHKFDIIVTANDEGTLNEDARAVVHYNQIPLVIYSHSVGEFFNYIWDVEKDSKLYHCYESESHDCQFLIDYINFDDFAYYEDEEYPFIFLPNYARDNSSGEYSDWEIGESYGEYVDLKEDPREIYYFASSNLSAWKLKYCLDNDTDRFVWADVENGKGVIYYMKDEWNNECPYDFKNIQYNGSWGYWAYTFNWINDDSDNTCEDLSVAQFAHTNDEGGYSHTYGNIIKPCENADNADYGFPIRLNTCVFLNTESHDSGLYSGFSSNIFGNNCHDNTFGNTCSNNIFGGGCFSNSFGYECNSNSFGYDCSGNTFGDHCHNNTLVSMCYDNSFGYNCSGNTLYPSCYNNTFGNESLYNTLGNDCIDNTFGDNCSYNTFGNNCQYIKFASDKDTTAKYNYYQNNHFGDGCQYILFKGTETASFRAQVQNYNFAKGLHGTLSIYLTIDGMRSRDYETKVAKNSNGDLKIYCEADLIQ